MTASCPVKACCIVAVLEEQAKQRQHCALRQVCRPDDNVQRCMDDNVQRCMALLGRSLLNYNIDVQSI